MNHTKVAISITCTAQHSNMQRVPSAKSTRVSDDLCDDLAAIPLQAGVVVQVSGKQSEPVRASGSNSSRSKRASQATQDSSHQTMAAFALQSTADAVRLLPSKQQVHHRSRRASTGTPGTLSDGVFGDKSGVESSVLSEAGCSSALGRSCSSGLSAEALPMSAWNRLVRFQSLKPKSQDSVSLSSGEVRQRKGDGIPARHRPSFLFGTSAKA